MSDKYGKIAQVIGPVVDVIFEGDDNIIPPIYTALRVSHDNGSETILEVEQHIGEDTVRCVSMESTDGLRRGMRVDNLERPIAVPTGEQVKGRLLKCAWRCYRPSAGTQPRQSPCHPSAGT